MTLLEWHQVLFVDIIAFESNLGVQGKYHFMLKIIIFNSIDA